MQVEKGVDFAGNKTAILYIWMAIVDLMFA